MEQRRVLKPILDNAIVALVNMGVELYNLEYHNNDKVSRSLKDKIVKFKANELRALEDAVKGIREEINKVKISKKTTKKQQKNEPTETVH